MKTIDVGYGYPEPPEQIDLSGFVASPRGNGSVSHSRDGGWR